MKIIIMAGGYGKRMRNIYNKPKQLLEINGKPVIQYITENLDNHEIIISTNKLFENDFKKWVEKIDKNYRIIVEDSNSEKNKLGTIAAINYVVKKENISEDCIVIGWDNIFGFDLEDFIKICQFKNQTMVVTFDLNSLELAKNYGVVEADNDSILNFEEKPENPKSTLISTACYSFPLDVLKSIPKYLLDGNNKDSPGNFISWLSKNSKVGIYKFDSYWFDVGTPEHFETAKKFIENL